MAQGSTAGDLLEDLDAEADDQHATHNAQGDGEQTGNDRDHAGGSLGQTSNQGLAHSTGEAGGTFHTFLLSLRSNPVEESSNNVLYESNQIPKKETQCEPNE